MDPRIWAAIFGAVGGVVSTLASGGKATWSRRTAMTVTGIALAAIFTPIVIEWMSLPVSWSDGVAALIGILGWAVVGKTLMTIQSADVWGLISGILRRWTGGN